MFYKAEILEADLGTPDCDDTEVYRYYGFGRIVNLQKTGRVYIYDIFRNGAVYMRYCSDGRRYISYDAWEEVWGHSTPRWKLVWDRAYSCDTETDIEAREYFHKSSGTAFDIIESLAYSNNRNKQIKAENAAVSKMNRCIEMFPDALSDDIKEWVDRVVFDNYIFMSNKGKGGRTGVCEACGKKFKTDEKHKSRGKCPKCGRESVYWLERYKDTVKEKKRINVFYRTRDYSLFRWVDVIKTFAGGKKYAYDDYWYSGICHDNHKCNFAYGQHHNYGYMVKKDWLTPTNLADSYVYAPGLDEALEGEYAKYIVNGYRYNMPILKSNLKNFPQTEYLLKSGLVRLAHDIRYYHPEKDERTLEELFGIDRKYKVLLRKYNCNSTDVDLIKEISEYEHVSEELFLMCKSEGITAYSVRELKNVFPSNASPGKIIRYISKQKGKAEHICRTYRDYVNMAKELKISLTKKYDIWPKDLQAEHDRLAEKINLKRNKKKNAEFKRKVKGIYRTVPVSFGDDEFVMMLPKTVDDFSREGQSLKICVGGMGYADSHMNSKTFICFIRKVEEPEKSFVCCELDLTAGKIKQIHGYKNDVGGKLPAGTRAFAEKYLKAVKEYRKELKGEVI